MVKATDTSKSSRIQARLAGKTAKGDEVWIISGDGDRRRIITSQSSAATMDDAMIVYSEALERLAKR